MLRARVYGKVCYPTCYKQFRGLSDFWKPFYLGVSWPRHIETIFLLRLKNILTNWPTLHNKFHYSPNPAIMEPLLSCSWTVNIHALTYFFKVFCRGDYNVNKKFIPKCFSSYMRRILTPNNSDQMLHIDCLCGCIINLKMTSKLVQSFWELGCEISPLPLTLALASDIGYCAVHLSSGQSNVVAPFFEPHIKRQTSLRALFYFPTF